MIPLIVVKFIEMESRIGVGKDGEGGGERGGGAAI